MDSNSAAARTVGTSTRGPRLATSQLTCLQFPPTDPNMPLFSWHTATMVDGEGPAARVEITRLLHLASKGDRSAADELMQTIEKELRKIASIHMRRERPNHTLQTTAVVNEALIRLLGTEDRQWNDRQHFLSVASRVMRRLLVDYARQRHAPSVPLDLANVAVGPISAQVLDVHQALEEFEAVAPRQAELVELWFFGGLSLEEAAGVLGIAPRTADKDWSLARAWLRKRLSNISSATDSVT
jgi:RNA polymerase sigma-70 factor (ECF subfamily)